MREELLTTPTEPPDGGGELRIRLLGRFEASVDGVPVPEDAWQRRHGRTLVKLLALAPEHRLHRDVLSERLWPDASPERASRNLSKALYMARHALEPALERGATSRFLARDADLILLRRTLDLHVDVNDFEVAADGALGGQDPRRLESAIARYGGELLPEDRFDPSLDFRREQLAQRHRSLLARLVDVREAAGELDAAIDAATRLLELDPACESVHRQLMRLYATNSQRARAQLQFEQCEALLRTELDVEPEPATRELHEHIRAGSVAAVETPTTTRPAPSSGPEPRAIAIVPLVNTGGDGALDYLCDGVAENLIYHLSKVTTWRVMAWNTVRRYRAADESPIRIGAELGVGRVLMGHVGGTADELDIAVELIDADDGTLIRGHRYVGALQETLALQLRMVDDVRDDLAGPTGAPASPGDGGTGPTDPPTARPARTAETTDGLAYHAYLKGRYHWNKRSGQSLREALRHFGEAIDHDPVYARAWSGLADSYALQSLYSTAAPHETMPKARAAAQRALAIDPALSEAHTSLAYCTLSYDWDLDAAESSFETALGLDPDYATARQWYHKLLVAAGRFDEAARQIERAKVLDPLSRMIAAEEAWGLYHSGRFDEALSHLERMLEDGGDFPIACYLLALVHVQASRPDAAVETLAAATAVRDDGPPFALGVGLLGHALARLGERSAARERLRTLDATTGRSGAVNHARALVHLGLDDADAAFAALHLAIDERYDRMLFLPVDPLYDPLRPDPRFAELQERLSPLVRASAAIADDAR